MKNKTCILFILSGLLLAGSLTGQNAGAMTHAWTDRDGRVMMSQEKPGSDSVSAHENSWNTTQKDIWETTEITGTAAVEQNDDIGETTTGAAVTWEQGNDTQTEDIACVAVEQTGTGQNNNFDKTAFREICKRYEPFGLTYDAVKDELRYNQKLVRWFEDYYPVGDGGEAGIDYLNEKGVVDIYAIRDLNNLTANADGSHDPGGKLTGLKEFSEEEFDARDIQAINNPPVQEALAGDPASAQERKEMAAEYESFGVTYNAATDKWYYQGRKVRYFLDILTSNGKDINGGEFEGSMRIFNDDEGTVDIYTVRDFQTPDADGNGTLTAVRPYSQQEFDARQNLDPGYIVVYNRYKPF